MAPLPGSGQCVRRLKVDLVDLDRKRLSREVVVQDQSEALRELEIKQIGSDERFTGFDRVRVRVGGTKVEGSDHVQCYYSHHAWTTQQSHYDDALVAEYTLSTPYVRY